MAGYSGTPLGKKLGLKPGHRLFVERPPKQYRSLLGPSAGEVTFAARFSPAADVVHTFVTKRIDLSTGLVRYRGSLKRDGVVWVSWPKKTSGVPSEITEDIVREIALPLGFVDVKVCAVDDVWSGLKLVIRKSLR